MNYASMLNRLVRAPLKSEIDGNGGGDAADQDNGDLYKVDKVDTGDKGDPLDAPDKKDETEDFVEGGEKKTKEDLEMEKYEREAAARGEKTEEDEVKEEEVKEEIKPTVMKLDAETIAALRAQGASSATVKKVEETLSPEQIRELLNPVEVKEDSIKMLLDPEATMPQKVKALQDLLNATVKNSTSITRLMMDRKEREFNSLLTPIMRARQEAELAQTKTEFYETNKDLLKYEKIVKQAATEVLPTNLDGSQKTKTQIFKEVGAKTRATLKEFGIDLKAANLGSEKKVTVVPKPNKLSDSGRSGGDNSKGKGSDNNPDADIYKR